MTALSLETARQIIDAAFTGCDLFSIGTIGIHYPKLHAACFRRKESNLFPIFHPFGSRFARGSACDLLLVRTIDIHYKKF